MIHNVYMQGIPRINRQDRQTDHVPWICLPQQCTPTTHTEAVHCQGVLLGSSISVSDHYRLLDPPLGRVAKPLVNSLMPAPPECNSDQSLYCGLMQIGR